MSSSGKTEQRLARQPEKPRVARTYLDSTSARIFGYDHAPNDEGECRLNARSSRCSQERESIDWWGPGDECFSISGGRRLRTCASGFVSINSGSLYQTMT